MPETLKCVNSIHRLEACATDEHLARYSLELLSPPTEQLRFTAAATFFKSVWRVLSRKIPQFPVLSRNRTAISRYIPVRFRIIPVIPDNPGIPLTTPLDIVGAKSMLPVVQHQAAQRTGAANYTL